MSRERLLSIIAKIEDLPRDQIKLYADVFLRTWDRNKTEIEACAYTAQALEEMYKCNISARVFDGGLAVSNFRDNSTRTRFSFASAANMLGLAVQDMDESKSQIAHGETVRETAAMISFLTQAIGIRDDLFLGFGHKYQMEVSNTVHEAFKEGVLPQIPAVVNLQCDEDHPTQSMADLCHLLEYFGGFEGLKGKKIAMTWAYSPSYGKPLSVPQGIIGLMTRFGMNVTLAHPEGYDLLPEIIDVAKKQSETSGGSFTVTHDMKEAFKDADIVYPKSWAPIEIMHERCVLLRDGKGNGPEMKALEKKGLEQNAQHKDWACTKEMMQLTKNGSALYMHCLPADITGLSCKEGEVDQEVFEKYRVDTYKEAGHKPYVIAAMILLNRFPDVADLLRKLVARDQKKMLL